MAKSRTENILLATSFRSAYRNWSDVNMEKAVAAVEKGKSIRRSAEKYGVPQSTLHDRVSN